MIRNVIAAYLDTVKEREFDLPLLALLPAMGFHDIHFTHGQAEFGKDFIAKKIEGGVEIQFTFQSKAGDVGQADWRNNIMGQMLESILVGLSHPNFDRNLPHQAILVTTGRLSGNAPLGLQDLNDRIRDQYHLRPIDVWDRESLTDSLAIHGLEGVHHATASGFYSLGDFYMLYGKSLQGSISEREIERHSRYWLDDSLSRDRRLLRAAMEVEIFAARCIEHGFLYEAVQVYLSVLRVILRDMHRAQTKTETEIEQMAELYDRAIERLHSLCSVYIAEAEGLWRSANRKLASIIEGPSPMATYPVHCARILEIAGYLYFIENNVEVKHALSGLIEEFIANEPGCAHTPSDRYAVSLVLPVILLCATSRHTVAQELLRRATVWLCDRYEDGWGLAPLEADPYGEIVTLFGYPFEFFPQQERNDSFLASVVSDLAAFTEEEQLYSDIVNDIKASNIVPLYWQVPDTEGLFRIEAPDVVTYPNVEYEDSIADFSAFEFAAHVVHEPRTFRLVQLVGPVGLMSLMLLLRDRYFPTVWPVLAEGGKILFDNAEEGGYLD